MLVIFPVSFLLLPFGLGGNSVPNRLNFPFFWLDATEWSFLKRRDTKSRVRLSRHRAGKDSGCL